MAYLLKSQKMCKLKKYGGGLPHFHWNLINDSEEWSALDSNNSASRNVINHKTTHNTHISLHIHVKGRCL